MAEVTPASLFQEMKAVAGAAALAEMVVLLQPQEVRGALEEEVLVEMVGMLPFRPATYSVAEAAAVEGSDPKQLWEHPRIWAMGAPIKRPERMETGMVSQTLGVMAAAAIVEESTPEAVVVELRLRREEAVVEVPDRLELNRKALMHQEGALSLPEAMEEMGEEAAAAELSLRLLPMTLMDKQELVVMVAAVAVVPAQALQMPPILSKGDQEALAVAVAAAESTNLVRRQQEAVILLAVAEARVVDLLMERMPPVDLI
jgi:hypothetical protein